MNRRDKLRHAAARIAEDEMAALRELPPCLWPDETANFRLSGRHLTRFFVCKLAEWLQNGENCPLRGDTDAVGLRECLRFTERLAIVGLRALRVGEDNEETLRALLWLMAEYGHQALGLDRRVDLEWHLGLAALEQPALYGLKPFYRDHLNHAIQVCLIGWALLETKLGPDGKELWQLIAPRMRATTKNEVLKQWFLASLIHDVGYVVEIGRGWTKLLGRFRNDVMKELGTGIEQGIGKLTERALRQDWGYDKDSVPGEDHGVAGALHLCELLKDLSKLRDPGNFEPAILAIARHSHWRSRIPFMREPLGVLLVLADELQEWDRPLLDPNRVGLALSAAAAYKNAGNQWLDPLEKIQTNITAVSDADRGVVLTCTGNLLDFDLTYRNCVYRNDGTFTSWLGRSSVLQRLDLEGAGFDVRYRVTTPIDPPWDLTRKDREEPQMERLRRFVRDQQFWKMASWFPSKSGIPEIGATSLEPVQYRQHDGPDCKMETVVLNVHALGKAQPILASMAEFWEELGKWDWSHEAREPLD